MPTNPQICLVSMAQRKHRKRQDQTGILYNERKAFGWSRHSAVTAFTFSLQIFVLIRQVLSNHFCMLSKRCAGIVTS